MSAFLLACEVATKCRKLIYMVDPALLGLYGYFSPTLTTITRQKNKTRNSSGDEIANVNFVYDDIVHVLQNTTDSCIPPQIDAAVMCGTHVYHIQ